MQPGWYPWPSTPGMKGYWDGSAWVAGPIPMEPHEMPSQPAVPAPIQPQVPSQAPSQAPSQGPQAQQSQQASQAQFRPVNQQGTPKIRTATPAPKKSKTGYYFGILVLLIVIVIFGWKFYERSQLPDAEVIVTEQSVEDFSQSEEKQSGFEELPPLSGETIWASWVVPANKEGTQVSLAQENGVTFEVQFLGTVGENSYFQTKITNTGDADATVNAEEIISIITKEGVPAEEAIAWSNVEPSESAEFGLLPESFPSGTQTVAKGESFIIPAVVNAKMDDVISIHIKALGTDYVDYVWLTE